MESDFKQLYELMKGMLEAARKKDVKEVMRINGPFSRVWHEINDKDPSALSILKKYDTCRNKCLYAISVNMFTEDEIKDILSQAETIFKKLPKP